METFLSKAQNNDSDHLCVRYMNNITSIIPQAHV